MFFTDRETTQPPHEIKARVEANDRIKDYRKHFSQIAKKLNNLLQEVDDLEEKHNEVINSTNGEELMQREQVFNETVENQKKSVESFQTEINKQLALITDKLETLLVPDCKEELKQKTNEHSGSGKLQRGVETTMSVQRRTAEERRLKSFSTKLKSDEKILCWQAVYNLNRSQIMCLSRLPDVVQILCMDCENDTIELERTVTWEKSSKLYEIAMTSDNTLYGCMKDIINNRWRVCVLRQNDFSEKREIDTSFINVHNTPNYRWLLRACGNSLAIITRLDNHKDQVYRVETVYIYCGGT